MNEDKIREFENYLQEANTILLGRKSLKFFGILSYGIKKYVQSMEDFNKQLQLPEGFHAAAFTDGERMVFSVTDDFSREDIMFTIAHELMHIISNHIGRAGDRDKRIWNLATDHVINRTLKSIPGFPWNNNCVFFEDLHSKHPNADSEEVYELLLDFIKSYTIEVSEDGKITKITDAKGNVMVCPNDTDLEKLGLDPEKIKEKAEEYANKAKSLWHSNALEKGEGSADFIQYMDNLFRVDIPWNTIMESAVLYPVQFMKRKSWSEPNFYYRSPRLPRLPGKHKKSSRPKILLVVIDRSGSVGKEDLETFLGVIASSLSYYQGLLIFVHDVNVKQEFYFEKATLNQLIHELSELKGGGGTSHEPVFNKIEECVDDYDVSSILFLTDFYSDVEQIYNNYKWIKERETIWVVNSDKYVDLPGCETKTIRINTRRPQQ